MSARKPSQKSSVLTRDLRPGHAEQWSARNQTLRHAGEKRERDDQAMLDNPHDYSAVGGPEDERAYGRTRSDNGYYPWNSFGGPHDRDSYGVELERGGYRKKRAPHSAEPLDRD